MTTLCGLVFGLLTAVYVPSTRRGLVLIGVFVLYGVFCRFEGRF